MASARRTGTSESVSTYNSGGGKDYSVLGDWESATDNDNVSGTVSPVLECDAGEHADTITFAGATNNATYFRILRPASGAFHTGIRDTGVRFYVTTAAHFVLQEAYVHVQDVVLRATPNSTDFQNTCYLNNANPMYVVGVIITASVNSGSGEQESFQGSNSSTSYVVDCLVENCEERGPRILNSATMYCYNVTSVSNGNYGFENGSGTSLVCKNCLSSTTGNDFQGTITGNNNASADATAPGTDSRTSQTFTFVDSGSFDYHLQTSDAGARNFGADLSADGTFAFDDDIDRQTITTWSIGMDSLVEVAAAASVRKAQSLRPYIFAPGRAR